MKELICKCGSKTWDVIYEEFGYDIKCSDCGFYAYEVSAFGIHLMVDDNIIEQMNKRIKKERKLNKK